MKKHTSLYITASIVALITASSCTLINGNVKKISANEGNEIIVPEDRQEIIATTQQAESLEKTEPTDTTIQAAFRIRSDWAIKSVFGRPAEGMTAPYLKFDEKTGTVYGNNGCNTINARYAYNPQDSTITITNVLTTMMACPDNVTDIQVNEALNNTVKYTWYQDGTDIYLVFKDRNNKDMLTLVHQNFEFLNGTWQVTEIFNKDKEYDNPELKLVIDIDMHRIHGNTGCNILNGQADINLKTINSISFHSIGVTRRMCPDMDTEKDLLVALEEVMYAKKISNNEAELLNDQNQTVLRLQRTEPLPQN